MWWPKNLSFRRAMFWLVVFAAVTIVGLAGIMLSGIYNVAASVQHFSITEYILKVVLHRSVAAHSRGGPDVPALSDDGLARVGASHFETGCAPCHGSPIRGNSPAVSRMYPAPPPLDRATRDWDTKELFWIVRHGLKFTGMPAWPGEGRDEEVWPLVAFLQRLPDTSPEEYAAMTGAPQDTVGPSRGFEFGVRFEGSSAGLLRYCASCHGEGGIKPIDDLVPPLAGQNAAYLRRSLKEYRRDIRQSGMMETVAAELDERTISQLADHFASQIAADRSAEQHADESRIRRGRLIAMNGIPKERVAPCAACHSGRKSDQFPRLTGLPAAYIKMQLQLFHDGVRARSPYAQIMHNVARHLNQTQMEDVAAYLASLPGGAVIGAETIVAEDGR